eukprot:264750-Chlamydomonas_euryale.AAC.7
MIPRHRRSASNMGTKASAVKRGMPGLGAEAPPNNNPWRKRDAKYPGPHRPTITLPRWRCNQLAMANALAKAAVEMHPIWDCRRSSSPSRGSCTIDNCCDACLWM